MSESTNRGRGVSMVQSQFDDVPTCIYQLVQAVDELDERLTTLEQAEAERVAARMRGLETDVLVMGADLRDARAEVERLRAVINMAHDAKEKP